MARSFVKNYTRRQMAAGRSLPLQSAPQDGCLWSFEPSARTLFHLGTRAEQLTVEHIPSGWRVVGHAPAVVSASVRAVRVCAEPLALERGCSNCGEPMTGKRKSAVCAPCAKEFKRKGIAAPVIMTPQQQADAWLAEVIALDRAA